MYKGRECSQIWFLRIKEKGIKEWVRQPYNPWGVRLPQYSGEELSEKTYITDGN